MRRSFLLALACLVVPCVFGVEPGGFEMHAVAENPTDSTKDYSLQPRSGQAEVVHVEPEILMGSDAVKSAKLETADAGEPAIFIQLTEAGAKRFGEITGAHVGQRIAIVAGGRVLTAPVVREAILGGSMRITGAFTKEEATALVAEINSRAGK